MKRIYTILIIAAALVAGFALGRYCPGSAKDKPLSSFNTFNFSPTTAIVRVQKGVGQTSDNYYYLNVLNYAPDSVTINELDSCNTKNALTIVSDGSMYQLNVAKAGVDSIPRSVFTQNSYTLVDSTIYARYGILYGIDNSGKAQSFSLGNIVSVQGGSGTLTLGVVAVDIYELK